MENLITIFYQLVPFRTVFSSTLKFYGLKLCHVSSRRKMWVLYTTFDKV